MNYNSVKMYNKSGSLLRIETTINNTRDFKVFRVPMMMKANRRHGRRCVRA
ncbi:MAG: hypothetical protein HS127_11235 [Planctomycetia bacterium]|nr:hypothetical protein [Planctomycetia bacterium]MBE7547675.1 hypothetical protein [Planctomycetia bacterium]